MQNTNTYGHESRQRRPYVPSYRTSSSSAVVPSTVVSPMPSAVVIDNNFPSLGSKKQSSKEQNSMGLNPSSGRFDILEEVVDETPRAKPAFSYSSMAAKINDKPLKKIIEEKRVSKKSSKIDTKGKKIYMTQQQYLYNGSNYNAEDVIIVDDNGQEIYYSDDDCNYGSDSDSEVEDNEAW
jgi:hypothetical protein